MYKQLLILFAFIGLSLTASAQEGLEIGIDIMPQTHWIMNGTDFDRGPDLDHVPSFGVAFGAHVGYNFSDRAGLQLGLLYSAQGQDYEEEVSVIGFVTNDYAQKLTYLKVPLLFKFNGDPSDGAYFIGMIGPQFGLLTKVEQEGTPPARLAIPSEKDAYNSLDIGAVLGLGLGISLSDELKLGILFRFDGSFADIENKDFWTDSFHNGRENSQNVTGGVMFSLNYILN